MHQHHKAKSKRIYSHLVALLHCFFILSCAQITTPTGGKKDTTPPEIHTATPPNFSKNFHAKEITIKFNEWIQPLTNPKSQVIISPNIEPFPKIDIARNELTIKFKDTLQANTTYNIFFDDNIKDNNEGNVLPGYKFLFSTGNFIDSLTVKGKVQTMLDKIPDNTFVLLYKEKEDSAFTKKRPFYIAKVDNSGSFSLENIKEGSYRIYALSDKNGNYYYDLPTEAIAFTDSMTSINSNIDYINLELFLPEDSILRIFDYDKIVKGGILHLAFNKEISFTKDEITATTIENKEITPVAFQDKEPKKMTIYLPKLSKDTNNLSLVIKHNGRLVDTLHIKTESKNFKQPVLFFTDTTFYKSLNILESNPLKLTTSFYGLEKPDTSKMILIDSNKVKIPFHVSPDEDLQTFAFSAKWMPGMRYQFTILDSALVDLVGNYNKLQKFSFLATSAKKAGNLLITYMLPQKNHAYIALLKDNSGKVLDKRILRDSQTVKINYGLQLAGTYSVEIIDDVNDNGIWNTGSFANKTLPEKIYKELKPIMIKENWDAEETIKVDFSQITVPVSSKLPENGPVNNNTKFPKTPISGNGLFGQ